MVAALIERKLRLAMRQQGISSLPIYPEDRPCKSPTMFDIVRLFRNVERYEVAVGDDINIFPAQLTDLQKQVLELLEVPSLPISRSDDNTTGEKCGIASPPYSECGYDLLARE